MEMSFCYLGFARPVVLLPKAQMLVTTVFPEFAGVGEGVLEMGRESKTDLWSRRGREAGGKTPLKGNILLRIVLFDVLKNPSWIRGEHRVLVTPNKCLCRSNICQPWEKRA